MKMEIENANLIQLSGRVNFAKQIISGNIVRLRSLRCLSAPNCDDLNREDCARVLNTCGECKSGYTGAFGSANDVCIAETALTTRRRKLQS